MHSPHRTPALACYALSQSALPLAQRLAACLAATPWSPPRQLPLTNVAASDALTQTALFAPARFCPAGASPFEKIGPLLAETYPRFAAHAFIGATGIAVRALAPLLEHKSTDAPVLVLDPAPQAQTEASAALAQDKKVLSRKSADRAKAGGSAALEGKP